MSSKLVLRHIHRLTARPAFSARKATAWVSGLTAVLVAVGVGMTPSPALPQLLPANPPNAAAAQPTPRVDLYGDPLPERAIARLGTLRLPEANEVLTPDGRIAVLRDNRIAWLDRTTRRELGRLSGPKDIAILWFAVSPDGRRVIYQNPMGLWGWDVATDRQVFQVSRSDEFPLGEDIWFSPDSRRFAWITHHVDSHFFHRTHMTDAADGRELWRTGNFSPLARRDSCVPFGFGPDGQTLVTGATEDFGGDLERAVVRSAESGVERSGLRIRVPNARRYVLAHNARTLAIGTATGQAHLWDLATGRALPPLDEVLPPLREGGSFVTSMQFSDDDRQLFVAHNDGTIRAWDWANRRELHQLRLPMVRGLERMALDGPSLRVVVSLQSRWRTFDLATTQERIPPVVGHAGPVAAAAFLGDGRTVATVSYDRTIRVWDATTGRELRRFPFDERAWTNHYAVSADGRTMVVTANVNPSETRALLLDTQAGQVVHILDHGSGAIQGLTFSADDRWLVTVSAVLHVKERLSDKMSDCITRVWDVSTGREVRRFAPLPRQPQFALDGRSLVSVVDRSLQTVDLDTGRARRRVDLEVTAPHYTSPTLSPDGRSLILSYSDKMFSEKLSWIEMATGRLRADVPLPKGIRLGEIHFSPDGRLLAAVSAWWDDARVMLWDAHTGQPLPPLRGHVNNAMAIAFAPDSRRLVSAGGDATALIWDVSDLAAHPAVALSPAELDAAWTALADADARKAYQALQKLADSPDTAVPFLRQRLRPAAVVDAARLEKLLADLASPRFAEREAATAALAALDMQAEAALRRLQSSTPFAEVKQRAEHILARLEGPLTDPERLRELRAVEALEWMATPAAFELLQVLAAGAPDARLTQEARSTLVRRK